MDLRAGARGDGPSQLRENTVRSLLSAASSLLFLAGAVASYGVPALTAPFYIMGSLVMLANAVRGAGSIIGNAVVRAFSLTGVAVAAFLAGFFL